MSKEWLEKKEAFKERRIFLLTIPTSRNVSVVNILPGVFLRPKWLYLHEQP